MRVLRYIYMTASSIPDGFSTEQLEELMKTARANTTVTPGDPDRHNIISRVTETADSLVEELGSMEIFKFLADYCLFQLTAMHKEGVTNSLDANDRILAEQWSEDQYRLKQAQHLLSIVYMGPEDFMCPISDDYCDECDN